MILDNALKFGDGISFSSKSASSVVESSVLNLGAGIDEWGSAKMGDIGESGQLWLNVTVESASGLIASSAAAGLEIDLRTKASASSIKSGSLLAQYTVSSIKKSASITYPDGTVLLRAPIPANSQGQKQAYKQYLGLSFKVLTATIASGKLTAWLGGVSETPK